MSRRILGICCSPRPGQTTFKAMQVCLKAAEAVGDVFRFGRVGKQAGEVMAVDRNHLADFTRVDAPDDLDVLGVGGDLVIDQEHPLAGGRLPSRGLDLETAPHIDGHGLRHVHVQPGVDCRPGMFREEIGRRLESNGLDARFDQPAVTLKAREAARGVHSQTVATGVGHLLEIVRHCPHLVTAVPTKQPGDPAPSAPCAHNSQLDLAARFIGRTSSHMGFRGSPGPLRVDRGRGRRGQCASQKAPPAQAMIGLSPIRSAWTDIKWKAHRRSMLVAVVLCGELQTNRPRLASPDAG